MKPGSEHAIGIWIPMDPSLESLLARLEALSLHPAFQMQRQLALALALRPYGEYGKAVPLAPLAEELALANLYVFADFFPQDGQLSLTEQLRDTITVHIPEEEREWLDPLKHSYMDLVEIRSLETPERGGRVALCSLGDGRRDDVAGGDWTRDLQTGQVLLTRVVRRGDRAYLPGTALVLSAEIGRRVHQRADQWRREMEVSSGTFGLGDWTEFVKRYGYVLLWNFAQVGLEALVRADRDIQYVRADGAPFLYAIAQYDHHAFAELSDGLADLEGFQVASGERADSKLSLWEMVAGKSTEGGPRVVARLTLSPRQLSVECDSPARLDELKHRLASTFGFALHFQGETVTVPPHAIPEVNLSEAALDQPGTVIVSTDDEHRLLSAFLESVYLEWADRPSAALAGETPRHQAATVDGCQKVAAVIDELEATDLAKRRTGRPGYDYHRLRARVGL